MYGDFLVPNNTNVNDSITTNSGAKWEKFYEYQFEESHAEGFEFPHDLDESESPLNLKGIMIVTNGGNVTGQVTLVVNGVTMISTLADFGNNVIKLNVSNGMISGFWKAQGGKTSPQHMLTTCNMCATPADSISSFEINMVGASDTLIEFFVLRGV